MALYAFLPTVLCIATVLAQTSTLAEQPATTNVPDTSRLGDINADYKLWGYEGCPSDQINAIKSGFSDMVIMVMGEGAITTRYPAIDWNSGVAQDLWGPAERNREYRKQIQGKTKRNCLCTQRNPLTSNQEISTAWQPSPMTGE